MNLKNSREVKISLGFLKDSLEAALWPYLNVDETWGNLELEGSLNGKDSDTIIVKIYKKGGVLNST